MPLVVHETAAQVAWRAPKDLAVPVSGLGARWGVEAARGLGWWGGGRLAWRYDGPEGPVELVRFREVQAVEPR